MTFGSLQKDYAAHRVVTYPLTNAKTPAIKGYQRVGAPASAQLALKFADALAAGFIAGARNRITVVDIDRPDDRLLAEIEARYGRTLRVVTPSGGWHLYYRHAGEARRIRALPDVDILGGGNVVAALSVTGKGVYRIERGTLDDLDRLPHMRGDAQRAPHGESGHGGTIGKGLRNTEAWRHAMREARHCDTLDDLIDVTRSFAEAQMTEPLDDVEVVKIAKSAWDYESSGENRFGSTGAWFPTHRSRVLARDPYLAALLMYLRGENAPGSIFMVADGLADVLGWPRRKLADARKRAIEGQLIELVQRPADGRAARYRWGDRR